MGRVRPKEVKLREEVTRRFVWLCLTVLCFAAPARPQAPARTQQAPIRTQQVPAKPDDTIIRVNVRLVRTLVTAKDAAGQLIGSLNKGDFAVYDNGVKQEIAVFDRETEQPLSVAMLVDTSASTGIELRY
jgi:hypothetical protein